jgi:hypothetical protein
VTEIVQPQTLPAALDVVEVVDRLAATVVSATVESVIDQQFVLRLATPAPVPEEAVIRWFDGSAAWQAITQFDQPDPGLVTCRLSTETAWHRSPARRSLRAPVDMAPMLVKVVDSRVIAKGRRISTVCVDISATGCRTTWLGRPPGLRDAVDVAWDSGGSEPGASAWVPARVARIIRRPFGGAQVSLTFEITQDLQRVRVDALHRAWLQERRSRAA